MQRSLFQQAVRMHGQDLSVLTEKHLQEDFIFTQEENEEQQLADQKAGEGNHRESTVNHPDTTAGAPCQDSVRLTGTMRDLVHVQSRSAADSSAEDSSKSDTSPEILPLGVPRELHEPFDDLSTKTKLFKNNGYVSQLHNFISKKAHLLFKSSPGDKERATLPSVQDTVDLDYYATLPPMEQFMVIPPDQSRKRLFEILAVDDIIAGSIVAIKDFGMFVQVVCLCGKDARYLQECDIVGLLPKGELGDRYSQKAQLDDFRAGDVVRCRVVKTDAVNEKVILTMINQGEQNDESLLGIINESELPVHYRRSQTQRETQESYDEMLDNTLGFDNPYNVSCLANMLDIDDSDPPSLMPGLQSTNFPTDEHAEALRKWQSHKWAMESVARGVEHFKASRHLEAMQQLNRALEIDVENVEGLVARGALFANQNNLSKAIKDFAEALRIKPSHKNANRYMCQTLYEKGKQCEENDEKDKAKDCYQSAVDINPDFKDALVSLQRLEKPSRRKSVKDESEEDGLVTSSEDSPQEQISAKQLREMITEEKSSTKKKKKKEKQSQGHEDGKGDTKVKKELKMAKQKKKKKKLRRRGSSSPEILKQKQKEPSSDSESESSEPPSPVPKLKRSTKELKEVQSPERGRLTGKKRSRNGSISPKRKSRSKTRKADLIRKKSKHASETSSSNDDDKLKEVEVKDKRNHRKSLERNNSVKAKHKVDMNRSTKESESSVASTSDEEPVKKKDSKKERKDRKVKEEVSQKKRKMKTKKEKIKRSRSSSSVSEESADSPSYSPMRKKSKPAKKAKKMHKKSKKRSDSVSSGSGSGSDSERKPSPPRKAHKKKKKNKKKKPKKKERSSSVSSQSVPSSESPERPKSAEEHSKKRKFKKKIKEDDHYSDRSSLDSSSSSEQQKVTNKKKDSKTRVDDDSPVRSKRRSRSASLVKKEITSKGSSDEGEEIKIGKKRSRSSEYSTPQVKDYPKRQSSREAVHSPTSERRQRMTSDEESEEEHSKKKAGHKVRERLQSPEEEESKYDMKDKTRNKQKLERKEEEDKKSRRSKRHSKVQSPDDNRKQRSASREGIKSDDRDKKKSRKSHSPAYMSPERKEPSEDCKQDKLAKHSEYSGGRSSREKHKVDEKDKKRRQRSYSSTSESPPRKGRTEDHKQEKSGKHSKTKEDSPERSKSTRRSRSVSPKGKREEEKEQRTPIRERKRKRNDSFKDDSNSLEMERRDRKSRDTEKEEKVTHRKESGETHNRRESPEGSSYHPISADSGKDGRKESPNESKKSRSKRSPSPLGRNKERSRSREDMNQNRYSRSGRSTSVDFHDRKHRSKSGSYDREKDKEHDNRSEDKDRERNRRDSKEERRSGSFDRGHTEERRLSDGDRHKNSEEYRGKSNERERPRSREDERRKENRDSERRASHDAIRDDRDRGRDKSKESQYHDLDRPSRRESRDRERSKERDRRDSGKIADSSRETRRKSREREVERSRERSRERSKERSRGKSRDRERSKERDRRDSGKSADSSREIRRKSREREVERTRERSRERSKERSTEKSKERDRRDSGKNADSSRENRRKSREREVERTRERSRERDRKDSVKNVDSSRERKDRSSERDKGVSGSRFESSRRDQKTHADSWKEIGKAGTKVKEGEQHQSLKAVPTLNVEDIPMPPEKPPPVVEEKKEPSPIHYVTSTSCKDEIIKVKSKWDTDSEDDESGASGPSQNRRGGGSRGASGGQKSFASSSQYSGSNGGGNTGGGKNYGGYRRHADDCFLENTSSDMCISETFQSCQHLSLAWKQVTHHEPLRLRGGCVASPPPKYESDHSDSDVSFSSSSNVDSEEPKEDSSYEDHRSVGRRYKSSSSDRSSGERSKKRFKLSRRRESRSSSRSSSTGSSGSWSSRSSSRSDISYSTKSKSRSPSSERSSSSYRSYSSNSKSSKKPRKSQRQGDQKSNTESSDSEGADEYNLFDSWEDYMDTKGHNLGKEASSNIREHRTVKLETGGNTVGKFNSPVCTDSEEDQESPSETDDRSVQIENSDDVIADDGNAKCDEDIPDSTECKDKPTSCSDLGGTVGSEILEEAQGMRNQAPILNQEIQLDRHSRKRDRDDFVSKSEHEASKTFHYQGSSTSSRYGQYGFRAGHVRQESTRHIENSSESYPVEYGNQLKVRLSHGSDHHHGHRNADRHHGGQWSHDHRSDHHKDERHYRSDRNSRHTYPQGDERQDYHRHSQRGYENHRRRQHGFRRRRDDDDDWGRGVEEVQERGTFFGLVTKSKEGLVSQLYNVCSSALELVRYDHRQWWL